MKNERDSLYNIFQREKSRVGNDFTLFYNEKQQSLKYSGDAGVITVFFKDNGVEDIYYRSNEESKKGIGELVQHTYNYGNRGILEKAIWKAPPKYRHIIQDYQYNRDVIGVEKDSVNKVKNNKKQNFER